MIQYDIRQLYNKTLLVKFLLELQLHLTHPSNYDAFKTSHAYVSETFMFTYISMHMYTLSR